LLAVNIIAGIQTVATESIIYIQLPSIPSSVTAPCIAAVDAYNTANSVNPPDEPVYRLRILIEGAQRKFVFILSGLFSFSQCEHMLTSLDCHHFECFTIIFLF